MCYASGIPPITPPRTQSRLTNTFVFATTQGIVVYIHESTIYCAIAAAAATAAATAAQSAVFAPATAIAVALLLWCCSFAVGVAHGPPFCSSVVVYSTYDGKITRSLRLLVSAGNINHRPSVATRASAIGLGRLLPLLCFELLLHPLNLQCT